MAGIQMMGKRFKVIAKPNSKKSMVLGWDDVRQALRVAVAAPADKNKANLELTKFLSKTFSPCRLVSGKSSKERFFALSNPAYQQQYSDEHQQYPSQYHESF